MEFEAVSTGHSREGLKRKTDGVERGQMGNLLSK